MNNSVTVVIPTMNRPDFVRKAVDSVKAQTHKGAEIIIVNNGSDERSLALNLSIPDVINIVMPSAGVAAARNIGARASRSDFIAFLDDDDTFLPEKLERQLFSMKHYNCDMVGCLHLDQNPRDSKNKAAEITLQDSMKSIWMYPSSVLVKTACVLETPFNEHVKYVEDYDWYIRFADKHRIIRTNDRLYQRNIHDGNATNYVIENWTNIQKEVLENLVKSDSYHISRAVSDYLANQH